MGSFVDRRVEEPDSAAYRGGRPVGGPLMEEPGAELGIGLFGGEDFKRFTDRLPPYRKPKSSARAKVARACVSVSALL